MLSAYYVKTRRFARKVQQQFSEEIVIIFMNGAETIGYSQAKKILTLIHLSNHTQKLAMWTMESESVSHSVLSDSLQPHGL